MNQPVRGTDRKRDKIGNRSKKKKKKTRTFAFSCKKRNERLSRSRYILANSRQPFTREQRTCRTGKKKRRSIRDAHPWAVRWNKPRTQTHTHTHFNPLQLDYQLNKSLFFAFNQRDEMVYTKTRALTTHSRNIIGAKPHRDLKLDLNSLQARQ